jgi:23S rRNA (adenine2503-C2)-methyltransferase
MAERPHLYAMTPDDLVAHLRSCAVAITDGEARRILSHVISDDSDGFPDRRPVAGRISDAVTATTVRCGLRLVERAEDPADGFVKYLLESPDGALSEAVRIPLEKPDAYSVCLSTQSGCAMACAFCATWRLGLRRNLAAWEIVAAFLAVRRDATGRATGAVFQGQGEPLANYDEVIRAARVLSNPCGGRVAADNISISTVGLVPAIRRYAREGHPYRLIVSLTSTNPERRAALLPVASRWSLDEVAEALREYAVASKGLVTVAWVTIAGLNTGDDEVEGLARLLGDLPLRVNLIEVNDPRPDGFKAPDIAELDRFRDALKARGWPVIRRYSGGFGAHAACGMLASVRIGG